MAEEHDDVRSAIKNWLYEQGYPLEMRVASAFRKAGFEVRQTQFYTDPESETQREIDVTARLGDDLGGIDIHVVVECKKSNEKPWLLFSSVHTLDSINRLFTYAMTSDSAREIIVEKKGIESFWNLPWASQSGSVGYGLTQAFTTGADVTYKATTSVLKAAIAQMATSAKASWKPFVFVFPVVVVEGVLFECTLDDANHLDIRQCDHGRLFLPLSFGDGKSTCIRIVSDTHLESFANEIGVVAKALVEYLSEEAFAKAIR